MNKVEDSEFLATLQGPIKTIMSRSKDLRIVIKKILDKANNYNVVDITNEVRLIIREANEESFTLIKKITSFLEKSIGKINLYIVNRGSPLNVPQIPEVSGLESLEKYTKMGSIPRILTVILTRKSYMDKIVALKRIFNAIYETNSEWILSSLAIDQLNELWPRIELFLIKESSFRPPIIDLLPIIHAASTSKNKEKALLFIEDMTRRLGLVARSWMRTKTIDAALSKFQEIIKNYDRVEVFIRSLYLLLKSKANLSEICSVLILLLPIPDKNKKALLIKTGCILSDEFLASMKEEIELNTALRELSKCLMEAEKLWAPEVSIAELLGMSWLTYVSSRILLDWIKEKINTALSSVTSEVIILPEDFLDLLKVAIVVALCKLTCVNEDCKLLVRMLLSIRKRFLEYPISLFSNIIEAIRNFDANTLSLAIYLQRVLEIHGHLPYLYLLNKYFRREDIVKVISLQHIIQSRLGIIARKVISYAMKNDDALKDINEKLLESDFQPHGVTAPLQWELRFAAINKLSEMINLAKHYMEDCGVKPNRLLTLLAQLLEIYPQLSEIKEAIRRKEISSLKESFITLSKASRLLKLVIEALRRQYGGEEAPLISKMRSILSNYQGSLNEAWEKVLLLNYLNIISNKNVEKSVISIPEIVKQLIESDKPIIMLVIDGLRIDDYLVKLKEVLLSLGFKLHNEQSLIALIPSVTTISRRAIFGGSTVLRIFSPYPRRNIRELKREDELLKELYGVGSLYLQGAVAHIKNIIMGLDRSNELRKVNAIVLSELEKAAHGAAEGFLAEISMEYAQEVSRLAQLTAKILKHKFNSPVYLIIASDHGLGLFTKETETDIKILLRRLAIKGFLDPAHEPYIVERYAIIPLISEETATLAKNLVELEFKSDIYPVIASEIGYEKIVLKVKGQDILDKIRASNILFLFPRGRRRFLVDKYRRKRVVLHGGLLPIETIVPFAIFKYE